MENTLLVKNVYTENRIGWYCRYHIRSDRMLNIRTLQTERIDPLFIDQEYNIYRSSEFYPWKTTE